MLSELLVGAVVLGGLARTDGIHEDVVLGREAQELTLAQARHLQELERALRQHFLELAIEESRRMGEFFVPEAPALNSYGPFSGLLTVAALSPMTIDGDEMVMIAMDDAASSAPSREQAIEAGAKLFSQGF